MSPEFRKVQPRGERSERQVRSMFEWLEREISAVKTPKFHLVDGPAEPKLREALAQSGLPLPSAYREFVLRFGNAKLYRESRIGYRIGVLAGPREETLDDGTPRYQIGFHEGARVCVGPGECLTEYPIYELELGSGEKVADEFGQWLTDACAKARKAYGNRKWEEILRGPQPFSQQEKEVIEARRRMHWRLLGVDSKGDHILEVTNDSLRTLPVLTVGVRSKNGRLNGAVRLKIGHVAPGRTVVLSVDCYKDLVSPGEIR